jgi:Holliday junction resolvase RusA-like endonuclease
MRFLCFEVPGKAVAFGTKVTRFGKGGKFAGTRKVAKAEAWEAEVRAYAANAIAREIAEDFEDGGTTPKLFSAPVAVEISIFETLSSSRKTARKWKTTRVDVDKVARLVLDAMTGVVYRDDAEVAVLLVSKILNRKGEPSRTVVSVREVGPLEGYDKPGADVAPASCLVYPPPYGLFDGEAPSLPRPGRARG